MRMTRAALRAQTAEVPIHEDGDSSFEAPLSDSKQDDLPVLKEITNANSIIKTPATPSKSAVVSPSSEHKQPINSATAQQTDVVCHSNDSTVNPDIVSSSDTNLEDAQKEEESGQGLAESDALSVSPSLAEPAADTADRSVAVAKTPKFDPTANDAAEVAMKDQDDSFVQSIKTRTPARAAVSSKEEDEDSFVQKISSRTPRRTSRIEDSVEAMDALEDAIEQFSEELPSLDALRIDSPVKERTAVSPRAQPKSTLNKLSLPPTASTSRSNSKSSSKSPVRANGTMSVNKTKPSTILPPPSRPTAVKAQRTLPAAAATKTKGTLPPTTAVAKRVAQIDGRASMSFSNSPLKTQPNIKKRTTSGTLSTSRPGFVPTKSTKAPTTSTFVLPGDVYAAKMKAEREAKKEAAEEVTKFKAKPVPTSRSSIVPRLNKASQARLSVAVGGTAVKETDPANKRISSLDLPKVRNPSNAGVKRASSVVAKPSRSTSREPKFAANVPRVASLTSKPVTPAPVPEMVPAQKKASGKEVLARSKLELKKQEDDKRQKEEAARKARAEAAERGRLASREWAEKKAKMAAAQKAAGK
ncbi:uncharacterized protein AB675_6700 [Cyphellophora attinorum]|uniref:Carboxylesterase family protein n=1 Tax=Cyphellophora attinorum TaxID=1664694 RepID=A0A0N1HDS7_9EURO|nr:uncharacterized protein AB675_6700 [Phialophora attinorum]KPI43276.1 hypothetical protein AB675_6700 [Phialophora attinorum]